jgi:hypothetical protein
MKGRDIHVGLSWPPQSDICPNGRTYPRKAVMTITKKITTPIDQRRVLGALNEP